MNQYVDRLKKLQSRMQERDIDYVIITSADFHNSEYVHDYFMVREFFSHFTGSNGTLLVGRNEQYLWTDGRYFIQAKNELEGTGIQLMKMGEQGVPTLTDYIAEQIQDSGKIAYDGRILTVEMVDELEEKIKNAGKQVTFTENFDPAEGIWQERPELPQNPVIILSKELFGTTFREKRMTLLEKLNQEGANSVFVSKLDEIMWLCNLRGSDISCNPVALSYFFMDENQSILFVRKASRNCELEKYAEENDILLDDYTEVQDRLSKIAGKRVLLDKSSISSYFSHLLGEHNTLIMKKNPITYAKAIKNRIEIKNMRDKYLKDSAAVTKFIFWLKKNAGKKIDEAEAADYLDHLREQIPGFLDLSFPTISAYGANAAMMHYEATKENKAFIKPEGFLLADSGGQYLGGTTDVTRTIVLGEITQEMKRDFTLVLKGSLALKNAKFIYGCTGRNLDILAREPLWQYGIDYKCGTGHGIGYMLNVHEGPQNIRWRYQPQAEETILEPGMIVSNEPGVYREGMYGIRTENIMLVCEALNTSDGRFLQFETLTMVPIDRSAIDVDILTKDERKAINDYHQEVYEKIHPYLNTEEREWLQKETEII